MSRKDFRYEADLDRLLGEPEPAPRPDLVASVMAAVDRAAAADRRVDELLAPRPSPSRRRAWSPT